MKKLFKFLVIVFMFVILLGTIEVNAAKITIVKDDNPDRVSVLSILDKEIYLEINNENNSCYIYENSICLGQCDLIIIDMNGHLTNFTSEQNSLGYVIIRLYDETEGNIIDLSDSMENYLNIDQSVILEN